MTCATTVEQRLSKATQVRFSQFAYDHAAPMDPRFLKAPEAEIAATSMETLPALVRDSYLTPENSYFDQRYADLYFGSDLQSRSPDVYVLPKDQRALCLLAPVAGVLLSDGATAHYALVQRVNWAKGTVTLSDPWAFESFLLPGRNLIGARATPIKDANGRLFLEVRFADFLNALRGIEQSGDGAAATIAATDVLYPQRKNSDAYLLWKWSRILANPGYEDDPVKALNESGPLRDATFAPGSAAALLQTYSFDAVATMPMNFRFQRTGEALPYAQAANAFVDRIDQYATRLPWILNWTLVTRARLTGRNDLRMAIINVLHSHSPHDIDFIIEAARIALDEGDVQTATGRLTEAKAQWQDDVAASIALKPAAAALHAFDTRCYARVQDWTFTRRVDQIGLLGIRARLLTDPSADVDSAIEALRHRPCAMDFDTVFFPELVTIRTMQGPARGEAYILAALQGIRGRTDSDVDKDTRWLAAVLRTHFLGEVSIGGTSAAFRTTLRASPVGPTICDLFIRGYAWDYEKPDSVTAMEQFCGRRRPARS